MAFVKKTWVDRQSEHPTRRVLTPTGTANEYDVSRAEGLVLEDGDPFNAENMNDLENRVAESINSTGGLTMALLWQNASPTSAFSAQLITLDYSEYDLLFVVSVNAATTFFTTETVNQSYVLTGSTGSASGAYAARGVKVVATGVQFDLGVQPGTAINNGYCIPKAIYGIKGVQDDLS